MTEQTAVPKAPELSLVTVTLLKGVIYQDKDAALWSALLKLQAAVRDFFKVLGLELVLDEAEGYAFLLSKGRDEDEETEGIPRLMPRRELSFPVSLLLALLRKKLAEQDVTGGSTRLILTLEEIVEIQRLFTVETSNEARLADQVKTNLVKIEDLGFIRKVKAGANAGAAETAYEVRRILGAFVDAQWLAEFEGRLAEYQDRLKGDKKRDGAGDSEEEAEETTHE